MADLTEKAFAGHPAKGCALITLGPVALGGLAVALLVAIARNPPLILWIFWGAIYLLIAAVLGGIVWCCLIGSREQAEAEAARREPPA